MREIAASDRLEAFRKEGQYFRDLSFPTISGAGSNGAIVHYRASPETEKRLEPGTLYLLDSGAQYLDGTTDITRTIAIGAPSSEMREHFTRVLKGHIALATARFPKGTTGAQLDALARRALWQEGLDYDHGTGHGVGSYLSVHEGPQRISKAPNAQPLLPGMIVSNEPGYYKTGAYGIRIENLIVVQPDEAAAKNGEGREMFCFETITLAPIDRTLVARDLLDRDETDWLDGYHARVRATIGPLVDAETARVARTLRPCRSTANEPEMPMLETQLFQAGNYRFISHAFQYSGGVEAMEGYAIERARFTKPLKLADGFAAAEAHMARHGRPPTAFCACELRSPGQFTDQGFIDFNRHYVQQLAAWGIFHDEVNPVARSNVCPEIGGPTHDAELLRVSRYSVPGAQVAVLSPPAAVKRAAPAGPMASASSASATSHPTACATRRGLCSARWKSAWARSTKAGPM